LEGKNFYYDNPLDESVARYAWHTCHAVWGTFLGPAHDAHLGVCQSADGIYVNLFVGSTMTLENVGGTDVEMVQATGISLERKGQFHGNSKAQKKFSLRIRVPNHNVSSL